MRGLIRILEVSAVLLLASFVAVPGANAFPDDDNSTVVIVYKDGHRQSLAAAQIARIEMKAPAAIVYKDGHREKISSVIERIEFSDSGIGTRLPGRNHFIGKWEVGEGVGHRTFFITLDADGDAKKSIGGAHGTWTLVDGEARITWDDGWRDVIRKVGSKHEKLAFEPGKTFSDPPSNVTEARNTHPKPI